MPVPIPDGLDRLALTNRLLRLTESAPFTSFRMKQGRLHAAEVVGCIQVGHVRINILPKVDTAEPDRDKDFLLNILRAAGYPGRTYGSPGTVRAAARDPIEVVITEVAYEMTSAMRDGIPRRYEERCEDSAAIRGRIDFTKLSTRMPNGQAVLPVRYAPLSVDNVLAQCIKWIASALFRLTRSGVNRQAFGSILANLASVENRALSAAQMGALQLSRYESHWAKSIAIGRLLLRGYFPDPTYAGQSDAFSLLFPLQHLFERAMRKILVAAMQHSGIQVSHRTEPLFLLQEHDDREGVLRLKPDYVFQKGTDPLAIADAKWKRVSEIGRAHGVRREDLYQVSAYLTRYQVPNTVIFVPQAGWMAPDWTKWYGVPDSDRRVYLVGVDIESLVSHNRAAHEAALSALSSTLKGILLR